jgi:uncharacterized protein YaeQ
MALKATIFKADLQVSDMGRSYYQDHSLTIARHPSETDERMMMRLLAFALHAGDALSFANRLTTDDEPDLWQNDLTGSIQLWIDIGQPDEKRILKACGRARQVVVYTYSGHSAKVWWDQIGPKLERVKNLTVVNLPAAAAQAMEKMAQRSMKLQFTIQDGQVWMADQNSTVHIELTVLKNP